MVDTVQRTLYLKRIVIKSRKKSFKQPHLEQLLATRVITGQQVGERHYPPLGEVDKNTPRCLYINRFSKLPKNGGFWFEICSYVPGQVPQQALPNFSVTETPIAEDPITDKAGNPKEVVHVASAVALGHALILETPKGFGGVASVEDYLTHLFRTEDEVFPRVHLFDVQPRSFSEMVERGGGIVEVIMKIAHSPKSKTSKFALPLSSVRRLFSGSEVLTASIQAKRGKSLLKSKDVLSAYDEYQTSGEIDDFTIVLQDGDRIKGIDKLKMRRLVSVSATKGRNASLGQLKVEMVKYLRELQVDIDAKNPRVLSLDGLFV